VQPSALKRVTRFANTTRGIDRRQKSSDRATLIVRKTD
jgi:hypothetical protein